MSESTWKTVVCLANSKKNNERCIAGKEFSEKHYIGPWIRPVSERKGGAISLNECTYCDGNPPQLLDIIKIPFKQNRPDLFQSENYLIEPSFKWKKVDTLDIKFLGAFCDNINSLWSINHSSHYGLNDQVPPECLDRISKSLFLIKPQKFFITVQNEYERTKVRARFTYKENDYKLAITDDRIERKFLRKNEGVYKINANPIYLCISLALPYKDNFCYKLCSSVIGL